MKARRFVHVLQHVAPEGPGHIATALDSLGIDLRIARIDEGAAVPKDLGAAAGLVVMGGPMGVYDGKLFPHLTHETKLIEKALRADIPVLGICLGSQLLAAALGARVHHARRKEVGWFDVELSAAARSDAVFGGVASPTRALHWHGDVFEVPNGAVPLASSAMTETQAFRHGANAYGILFHLEATATQVRAMASAFEDELIAAGVSPSTLVRDSEKYEAATAPVAVSLFTRWGGLL